MRSTREPSLCDSCIHTYEFEDSSASRSASSEEEALGLHGPISVRQRYCDKPPPDSKNPAIEGRALHFGGYQECEYYTSKGIV